MPNGFFRSEKGIEEYQKIGKEYPNTQTDEAYLAFLKRTSNSPHSARNRKELHALVRELGDDGNEHLVWDMREVRYTPLGAEDPFYCPRMGVYPIPITRPQLVIGENMQTTEIVSGNVIRNDIGYEMDYTKENVEKLHEFSMDKKQQGKTQYIVRRIGGQKIGVNKYEDFRDGEFDDLERNGKITITSQETERKSTTRK
jgi:hypothetical protein